MKNYLLGTMQGRLVPKYQGRYQAHPVGYWQQEFPLAAQAGLDLIEFILDFGNPTPNPLMNSTGLKEIASISEQTGVAVKSICADYFMEDRLHNASPLEIERNRTVLDTLLQNAAAIGVESIVIPCVDQSSLQGNPRFVGEFIENIKPSLLLAEKVGVNLALETDLPPEDFGKLLERIKSDRIKVNYDIGNSAALGYDCREELATYGGLIVDIHIKDRVLYGGSVALGTGNAKFADFFSNLRHHNFRGIFVMQAFRDEEGLSVFHKQLQWIRPYLDEDFAWEPG